MAHCEKLLVYKIGWGSPVGLVGGDCGDCFYSREGLATLSPRSRYPQGCNDTRSKYSLATRELMSCEACHLEPNEVRVNQKKIANKTALRMKHYSVPRLLFSTAVISVELFRFICLTACLLYVTKVRESGQLVQRGSLSIFTTSHQN
jgi:hypothetical protein